MEILKKIAIGQRNIRLCKCLLNGTAIQIKRGKQRRKNFGTTQGGPQSDVFSLILFTLYLNERLRAFDFVTNFKVPRQFPIPGHEYDLKVSANLASYTVYADDLDFKNEKDENLEINNEKMKDVQSKQILIVKESKKFVSTQMSNPMQESSEICWLRQPFSTCQSNWLVLLCVST